MQLIERDSDLPNLIATLSKSARFFLDTEFESTRGGTTLCLIQVSDGSSVYLVDALRVSDLASLGRLLGGDDKEWVLHAAQQDIPLLQESLGLTQVPRLLDTQVAWACCSAEASVSLAYLEMVLLGVKRGKGHQRDDWKRRPLPQSQLAYAAEDVANLPALYEQLRKRLDESARLHVAYAASREVFQLDSDPPRPLRLADFRNAWQLGPAEQAALLYLIDWFGALSDQNKTRAPDTKTLLSIAARMPRNARDLGRIKGVSQRFAEREGAQLCAALNKAAASADAEVFEPIPPPPYATFDEIRRDAWLSFARAEICAELGVAPELLLPPRLLKTLRAIWDDTGNFETAVQALRGFRRDLLGRALLEFTKAHPPPSS